MHPKVHSKVFGSKHEKPRNRSRTEAEMIKHTAEIIEINAALLHSSA